MWGDYLEVPLPILSYMGGHKINRVRFQACQLLFTFSSLHFGLNSVPRQAVHPAWITFQSFFPFLGIFKNGYVVDNTFSNGYFLEVAA